MDDPRIEYVLDRLYPEQNDDRAQPHYVASRRRIRKIWDEFDVGRSVLRRLISFAPDIFVQVHEKALAADCSTVSRRRESEALSVYHFEGERSSPDFNHWLKMERWTIDEGIALALGKNPETINLRKAVGRKAEVKLAEEYCNLHDIAQRHFSCKIGLDGYVCKEQFIEWTGQQACSQSFRTATAQSRSLTHEQMKIEIDQLRSENRSLRDKSDRRRSMQKIILSIAIKRFRHEPTANRNTSVQDINTVTELAGLCVDADTVRTILTEASSELKKELENAHKTELPSSKPNSAD